MRVQAFSLTLRADDESGVAPLELEPSATADPRVASLATNARRFARTHNLFLG